MDDANASNVPLLDLYSHGDNFPNATTSASVGVPLEPDVDSLNSIIHQHARDGNVAKMEEVLNKCPELINRSDNDGFTALHYAAKYGNLKVVEMLLIRGATANVKSKECTTPLHMSAKYCRPYAHYSGRSSASPEFVDASSRSGRVTNADTTTAIVNLLVRQGADVDAADAYGLTPLHYAAMKANEPAAQALLMSCANVNAKGVKGMTPLLTACVHGSDDVVRLLLSSGAECSDTDNRMNSVYHIVALHGRNNTLKLLLQYGGKGAYAMLWSSNNEGKTPLHLAVDGNHPDMVRTILELKQTQSLDSNAKDKLLLHGAAGKGYLAVVQCLIHNGYDPCLRDDDMQLPLHVAASHNRADVVQLLVKLAPYTIEDKTDYGMTPLLNAVSSNALEVVKILVDHNADICATDIDGRTAIYIGAKYNAIKVLRYLLDLCRQKDYESSSVPDLVNHPDHNQMTAMHIVCNNGYIEVSKLLYEYGASIDALNEEEETPLHLAAAAGETISVRQLLEWDKRLVLHKNEDADTPLHLAAKNGRAETMKVLLDAGADVEARNSYEHTALQCAVLAGHLGTVRHLLDKGAIIENKDDKSDSTALHLASRRGHHLIVQLLLQHGATIDRRDENGKTALDLAIENDHREVVRALLDSEHWMDIMSPVDELPVGRHTLVRDTPMRKLISKYPELAESVFDKCIRYEGEDPESLYFFCEYDFTLLDDTYMMLSKDGTKLLSSVSPYKADGTLRLRAKAYSDDYDVVYKNHPLKMMAKCEVLLSHHLVLALLKHKWNTLGRYVYYFALAIYLLFLCSYTLYVTHTPAPFNVYDEGRSELLDLTTILVGGEPECPDIKLSRPPWLVTCKWTVISLAIAQLFKELFQLLTRRHRYISLDNAIECFIYSSAIVSVVDLSPCSRMTGLRLNWQWLLAAVCAFLSWMNLLLLIRKLPRFGIYVVMFFDVLRTFSRFFIVFALFVVAFSIAFFAMMQNRPEFSSVPSAVLKTTVMMIGEFEFTAIFHGDAESHPERLFGHAVVYPIFLFFCVIMTILLMNLLVGLAVDDIKSVLEEAKLKRLSMQADLVLQIEASMPYIRKLTSRSSVRVYPNQTSFLKRLRNRFGFDSSTGVLMEEQWQSREEELLSDFRRIINDQNDRIRQLQENIDVMYAGQLQAKSMIRSVMKQLQIDFHETDNI